MRIEGLVSKKAIKKWLENYEYLAAGDKPPDAPPSNSGPKAYDGVTGGQLNKIMLDQAVESLSPLTQACIRARYIHKLPLRRTLKALGISAAIYYNRCDQGINDMYFFLNGKAANTLALLKEIKKTT